MRERAWAQAEIGTGSDTLMHQGMRAWMEAGWQQEEIAAAMVAPAPEHPRSDQDDLQPIAVMLAGLLLWQAERNYGGQRKA